MNAAKRGFAPTPGFLENMAAAAPGGEAHQPTNPPAAAEAPKAAPAAAPAAPQAPAAESAPAAIRLPVREASQTMSLKCPKSLYDELRDFMKLTDIPMTQVMVDGARKELALLKKKFGIEG